MLKGLIAGIGMGVIVAGLGLGTLSLMAPQPAGSAPPAAPDTVPPDTAPPAGAADAGPETPSDPTLPPVQPITPTAGAPATAPGAVPAEAPAPGPEADTASAAVPRTAPLGDAPAAPGAEAAPGLAAGPEAPVLPSPRASGPAIPAGESDIVLSTDPGAPTPPAVEEGPDPAPVADAEPAPGTDPVEAGIAEGADETGTPAEAPLPEEEEAVVVAGGTDDAATDPDAAASAAPDADPAIEAGPATGDGDAPPPGDGVPAEIVVVDEDGAESPAIALRGEEAGLPGADSGVTVRRPGAEGADDAASADAPVEAEAVDPDAPPLERYAAAFDNPQDQPLLSIVLIDDGTLPGAPAAVAGISFPVTIALDPAREDAAAVAQSYRDLGFEVALLPSLPAGATASDVEVTLEAAEGRVPGAVALIDPAGAWQAGGGVADQALARLGEEGLGFVSISTGLNPGLRAAEAEDVPAAIFYRDLDGEGQDARVIRRFIDQAAFRARQDSGVVLLARTRPDTLSALILWGTANRAGQVALAPLSAALLEEAAE
ncbi:polysaccharide deacteylase family 2 protein [Wenxinia saemankumensis]|uniref:Uncharacterized conserved protein YibQ, putative polysaccharide deacetylase 2 family n=1 Tax=Wenxinia saemankumensis TaxID=1447782 RepID=A0A1M6D445_9RHOB|nr:polysaccharide deacteylase family 2 protein [Wenxinia saemankumensis]SHI68016.1 Uncharacterized conserved protein YibQ, putative polysaccharide deacetylase 2 family [Wenxinia saemankumensis]